MTRLILWTMAALPFSGLMLFAQHPCDLPELAGAQALEGAALSATFCQVQTQNIDAVTIRRDGNAVYLSPLQVLTGPNAQGLVQYRVSLGTAPARGTYSYTAATWNRDANGVAQEGPQGPPFALSVVVAPVPRPTAPSNLRIG